MKNFVKLLVIAMAPVLLTSAVNAGKPAPKEKSLAELKAELDQKMPTYYSEMLAAYYEAIGLARQIQSIYATIAEKKLITADQRAALRAAMDALSAQVKAGWFEWLGLTKTSTDTLRANMSSIWNKIAAMELQDKTDAKKKIIITYYTADWYDKDGDLFTKLAQKSDKTTMVTAKTYGDIPALRKAIGGTYMELTQAAQIMPTLGVDQTAIPVYMQDVFNKLAKIDFISPIQQMAKAEAMKDLNKDNAFVELYEDVIIPLKAKIAELEKAEAAAPKNLAVACNMLLNQ